MVVNYGCGEEPGPLLARPTRPPQSALVIGECRESNELPEELLAPGVVVIAGPFGSGKTEIAINLAVRWAVNCPIYLADLDIVTPYFRPRDIADLLATRGVSVIAPSGRFGALDSSVLPPQMVAIVANKERGLIIDVGGHLQGAAVLTHWQEALRHQKAKLLLVVNPRRPYTGTTTTLATLAAAISQCTGLDWFGIIANGNLGVQTTIEHVAEGLAQAKNLSSTLGVPVVLVCCPVELTEQTIALAGRIPVLGLNFYLRPPWQRRPA